MTLYQAGQRAQQATNELLQPLHQFNNPKALVGEQRTRRRRRKFHTLLVTQKWRWLLGVKNTQNDNPTVTVMLAQSAVHEMLIIHAVVT